MTPEQWTVPGIFFDTEGWRLESAAARGMSWSARDARLTLTVAEQAADDPATLTELRGRHRADARSRGEDIVEVERVAVSGGHGLSVLIKQRSGPAVNYRATLQIHQGVHQFVIASEFDEGSFTGARDAIVTSAVVATCGLDLGDPAPDGARMIRGYAQDAYDAAFDSGALNSCSDDRRVDELVPEHPLSRLRRWLGRHEASIVLAADTAVLPLILDEEPQPLRRPRLLLRAETMWYLYESAKRPDLLKTALMDEIMASANQPSERAAMCWLYRGCLDNKAGHHLGALLSLQKADAMYRAVGAHEAAPMVEVQAHLGVALRHLGRHREALARLREAIRLLETYPNDGLEMLATGQAAAILAERGVPAEQEEARRYLERAQELVNKLQSAS